MSAGEESGLDEDEVEAPDVEVPDRAVRDWLGPAWPRVAAFADLLARHGVERGLLGPRELPRLWSRHLLNSAALAGFLPDAGTVVDVGSGAGLPGVVLAAMRPDLQVHLVEPMQRRAAWLIEVVDRLHLGNTVVHVARAEDLSGRLVGDVVTARAVAPLERLGPWALPLVRPGGRMVVLKGRRAADELAVAGPALRRRGAVASRVHEVSVVGVDEPTYVVEVLVEGRRR